MSFGFPVVKYLSWPIFVMISLKSSHSPETTWNVKGLAFIQWFIHNHFLVENALYYKMISTCINIREIPTLLQFSNEETSTEKGSH